MIADKLHHCRYYCGLSMMETRFPISRERDHVHIGFKWYDAFRPTRSLEQCSIHFEKAAVLFNLGAVLTQQALGYDRSTDAGLKDAARKFQVNPAVLKVSLPAELTESV